MGPSGCGKTTLLRLIAAQLKPSAGEVWVNGRNLPQLSRSELFDMRKQFGVLFQSGALFTDLDVFENVAFPPARAYRASGRDDSRHRTDEIAGRWSAWRRRADAG